jgi:hypothetical protein
VAAKDLHAGSLLQTKYESWLDVDKVVKHGGLTTVYNFEVQGFHTYFVSDLGLLVHNTCYTEGLKTNRALDLDASSPNPAVQGNQWHPRLVEDRSADWARLAADIESRVPDLQQYSKPIGPSLPTPQATNSELQRKVLHLYEGALQKDVNPIGRGNIADMIRHERNTGLDYLGKPLNSPGRNPDGHTQRGEDGINSLQNWLDDNPLATPENPTGASFGDRSIAQTLINDLRSALTLPYLNR